MIPAAGISTDDVWSALATPADQAVVRRGEDGWSRPALLPVGLPEDGDPPLRDGGVYWVVGGTSGIGAALAEELARRTRGTLVLSSRRSAMDGELRTRIEGHGAVVDHRPVDVADPDAVAEVAAGIRQTHGGLHGIVHSAGALVVAPLADRSPEQLAGVLNPKVTGGPALVAAADGADWVALVSSLAAHVPSPGQADYAAASGALGDLAQEEPGSVPVIAVDFGPWGETGMVADDGFRAASERIGLPPMSTAEGVDAFFRILAGDARQVVVTRVDSPRRAEALRDAPSKGNEQASEPPPPPAPAPPPPPDERLPGTVEGSLRETLAGLLRLDPGELDVHVPFAELGVDSLMATQVVQGLEQRLGIPLHPTLLFEHPTPEALLAFLRERSPEVP